MDPMAHSMTVPKAAITTHVLDQTTGLPAAGILVELLKLTYGSYEEDSSDDRDEKIYLWGVTDRDGRISNWSLHSGAAVDVKAEHPFVAAQVQENSNEYISAGIAASDICKWSLTFYTKTHFESQGKRSVWSKISLYFETEKRDSRQHWHMPLLLGPFGYTTYRGS